MTDDHYSVDSATLKQSLARDLKEAQYAAGREDYAAVQRWTTEARNTAFELVRRAHIRRVK